MTVVVEIDTRVLKLIEIANVVNMTMRAHDKRYAAVGSLPKQLLQHCTMHNTQVCFYQYHSLS